MSIPNLIKIIEKMIFLWLVDKKISSSYTHSKTFFLNVKFFDYFI